ncbi:hypothetical protein [Parendozoicomonas haliclonae]|uniref:Uncharacterized protein n=1 Tax=Parendozoicomonas haliclonae TaxID=1960125 RepID=A0A1X7AJD5_9GAMM|nr:hypothetical protein [Parendozoicomonas haliclonae]SMA46433.1 hypothetical protein EHSB41UT_02172 [Parendozoicomonas haliclonae]
MRALVYRIHRLAFLLLTLITLSLESSAGKKGTPLPPGIVPLKDVLAIQSAGGAINSEQRKQCLSSLRCHVGMAVDKIESRCCRYWSWGTAEALPLFQSFIDPQEQPKSQTYNDWFSPLNSTDSDSFEEAPQLSQPYYPIIANLELDENDEPLPSRQDTVKVFPNIHKIIQQLIEGRQGVDIRLSTNNHPYNIRLRMQDTRKDLQVMLPDAGVLTIFLPNRKKGDDLLEQLEEAGFFSLLDELMHWNNAQPYQVMRNIAATSQKPSSRLRGGVSRQLSKIQTALKSPQLTMTGPQSGLISSASMQSLSQSLTTLSLADDERILTRHRNFQNVLESHSPATFQTLIDANTGTTILEYVHAKTTLRKPKYMSVAALVHSHYELMTNSTERAEGNTQSRNIFINMHKQALQHYLGIHHPIPIMQIEREELDTPQGDNTRFMTDLQASVAYNRQWNSNSSLVVEFNSSQGNTYLVLRSNPVFRALLALPGQVLAFDSAPSVENKHAPRQMTLDTDQSWRQLWELLRTYYDDDNGAILVNIAVVHDYGSFHGTIPTIQVIQSKRQSSLSTLEKISDRPVPFVYPKQFAEPSDVQNARKLAAFIEPKLLELEKELIEFEGSHHDSLAQQDDECRTNPELVSQCVQQINKVAAEFDKKKNAISRLKICRAELLAVTKKKTVSQTADHLLTFPPADKYWPDILSYAQTLHAPATANPFTDRAQKLQLDFALHTLKNLQVVDEVPIYDEIEELRTETISSPTSLSSISPSPAPELPIRNTDQEKEEHHAKMQQVIAALEDMDFPPQPSPSSSPQQSPKLSPHSSSPSRELISDPLDLIQEQTSEPPLAVSSISPISSPLPIKPPRRKKQKNDNKPDSPVQVDSPIPQVNDTEQPTTPAPAPPPPPPPSGPGGPPPPPPPPAVIMVKTPLEKVGEVYSQWQKNQEDAKISANLGILFSQAWSTAKNRPQLQQRYYTYLLARLSDETISGSTAIKYLRRLITVLRVSATLTAHQVSSLYTRFLQLPSIAGKAVVFNDLLNLVMAKKRPADEVVGFLEEVARKDRYSGTTLSLIEMNLIELWLNARDSLTTLSPGQWIENIKQHNPARLHNLQPYYQWLGELENTHEPEHKAASQQVDLLRSLLGLHRPASLLLSQIISHQVLQQQPNEGGPEASGDEKDQHKKALMKSIARRSQLRPVKAGLAQLIATLEKEFEALSTDNPPSPEEMINKLQTQVGEALFSNNPPVLPPLPDEDIPEELTAGQLYYLELEQELVQQLKALFLNCALYADKANHHSVAAEYMAMVAQLHTAQLEQQSFTSSKWEQLQLTFLHQIIELQATTRELQQIQEITTQQIKLLPARGEDPLAEKLAQALENQDWDNFITVLESTEKVATGHKLRRVTRKEVSGSESPGHFQMPTLRKTNPAVRQQEITPEEHLMFTIREQSHHRSVTFSEEEIAELTTWVLEQKPDRGRVSSEVSNRAQRKINITHYTRMVNQPAMQDVLSASERDKLISDAQEQKITIADFNGFLQQYIVNKLAQLMQNMSTSPPTAAMDIDPLAQDDSDPENKENPITTGEDTESGESEEDEEWGIAPMETNKISTVQEDSGSSSESYGTPEEGD